MHQFSHDPSAGLARADWAFAVFAALFLTSASAAAGEMEFIRVADDGKKFVLAESGRPFVPWGFNYDHDEAGRLIEDYWRDEWAKVEEDFREMRSLGANVVRVHLQLGRFMKSADEPNAAALKQLGRLTALAETNELYLDLTGLGCYHKKDVPAWYDALDEPARWDVQARFWEAVARQCADSPAVFCYDLMNEPVVPGGTGKRDDWLGPAFGDKHFVQFIALETRGRSRSEIARQWVRHLVGAIRKHDKRHLVTVGLVPWSLDRPGLTSGFVPQVVAKDLDFLAVHLYPETDKLDEAMSTLKAFQSAAIGKPVVIEETFPLKCTPAEFEEFIGRSEKHTTGWIGFYWGQTPQELADAKTIGEAVTRQWLEFFQEQADRKRRLHDSAGDAPNR